MNYNSLVEQYFFQPKHVATDDFCQKNTALRIGSQDTGGTIDLYLQRDKSGAIARACFKAYGNPYVMAAAEWMCCQLEARSIDEQTPCDYKVLLNLFDIPKRHYPTALQIEKGYNDIVTLLREKR